MSDNAIEKQHTIISPEDFIARTNLISSQNSGSCDRDFPNTEIKNAEISNKNLASSEFNYCMISDVKFKNVNLSNTEYYFTVFNGVTFERCNITGSSFEFSTMHNVRFVDCILHHSTFDFTSGDVIFENCLAEKVKFPCADQHITMNKCNACYSEFNGCSQLQINFSKCDLTNSEFNDSSICGSVKECIFTDAEFKGSDLEGVSFEACRMRDITSNGSNGLRLHDPVDTSDIDDADFF